MKLLLQINSVVNSGSTGHIVEDIGQIVTAHGWNSCIAYGRGVGKSRSKLIRIGNNWSMKWHGAETRLLDRHGLASRKATRRLIKQIQKIKPDIIHLHNIHGYYLNYSILFDYLSASNIPVVWTLHDCWSFTGHCSYYTNCHCNKWQKKCFDCPQKKAYPASYGLERSEKNFKDKRYWFTRLRNLTLVPVSDWLAKEVKKSFFKEFPVLRIYNGVNIDIFKPFPRDTKVREKYGIETCFLVLGVANIWDERKGLEDFFLLQKRLPKDCQIFIIGLSEKQLKSLPPGIIGIKRTADVEELARLYAEADVFVNPSVEETFGMTTVESLACGTPVVVYNSTASPELVDEKTGCIVECGDINRLSEAICTIKNKGKLFYSSNCRERVINHFDKEKLYQVYFDLYNRVLNNNI